MQYIFLSDGYKGGNTTFIEQNIQYILHNKKKVLLIDKDPKQTFKKLKENKYLSILKLDIFRESRKVKKILKNEKTKNFFFFFTNFKILIYYFLFFHKCKNKKIKLAMALHSGIFKYNLKTLLGLFLFFYIIFEIGLFSLWIELLKKWWVKLFPG